MLVTLGVLLVCVAAVIVGLLHAICRHREASWLASETSVLCLSAPLVMLLGAVGIGLLAWVATHGGFAAALNGAAVLTSALVIAASFVVWRLALSVVRARPAAAAPTAPSATPADLSGARPPRQAAPAG